MSFWYPGNVDRRSRAEQLANDISSMQQAVTEARDAMDKSDKRTVIYLNQILANHGMKTFDDLKQKLDESLTPAQKAIYESLIRRSQLISEGLDNALMGVSAVLFASGVIAKTIDIVLFLRAGHVIQTFRDYQRAFRVLITEGIEAGKAAFTAATRSSQLAVETLENTSTVAKNASRASRLLKGVALLGVVVDAVILAFALYEEGKQRDALRGAIHELYVRRIISKYYQKMCDAVQTQNGLMLSYMLFVSDPVVDPLDQASADKIAAKLVQFVQEDWTTIDSDSCLTLLITMDHKRGSWMEDDPGYADAIKEADDDLNPSPTTVAATNTLTRMFGRELAVKDVHDLFSQHYVTGDTDNSNETQNMRLVSYMKRLPYIEDFNKDTIVSYLA